MRNIPAIGGTAPFCGVNCCWIGGINAVVVVLVLPGIVDGGIVPIGGMFGPNAIGGALDVTEPNDEAGRPRLMPAAAGLGPNGLVNGEAPTPLVLGGPFFLLFVDFALSISTSSFGISANLVKNTFSSACAITTTSSPGLLYT